MKPSGDWVIGSMKRREFFRPYIHHKITVIFGIICAVVLIGIYLFLNQSLKRYTYQRIRTNLFRQTTLAKTILGESLHQCLQAGEMDRIADKIGKDLDVRATIIGLDGQVLGDSELDEKGLESVENHLYRPEVQDALRSGFGESKRFSTTIQKDMLYMAATFGQEKPQGFVRLSLPLLEIDEISGYLKKLLLISLLIAFIFSMIISYIASVFISRPIKEMSQIASDIAKGDFSRKVSVSTHDEVRDLAGAFNDMADQINARIEEVTASRSRLEAVLLSMSEGVMVVDSKCAILLMNRPLKDFLLIRDDPKGKKLLEVIRNIKIQEIAENVLDVKKEAEPSEISVHFPEEKILLIHATPVVRGRKTEGAVLVFHDITKLRQLERIRQDFVANVSHELRTPVTIIKGYAETLLEGALKDTAHAKEFLKIIYSDSNRLARLIDDLLDLSRIESGKLDLTFQPVSIKATVEHVVSELRKQARERSVIIHIDIPEDLPDILADEGAISQVLLNLLDNAIKYNQEKGSVTVSAREQGDVIHVAVCDTGVGIPEKDLNRIFERFYRVDKARSRELGGTGLGLSIVKHIVQEHKGQVAVESVIGRGSTFSFTVPKA